jgi:hypothetical protein
MSPMKKHRRPAEFEKLAEKLEGPPQRKKTLMEAEYER